MAEENIDEGIEEVGKSDTCVVISAGKLQDASGKVVYSSDLAAKVLSKKSVDSFCVFTGTKESVAINKQWTDKDESGKIKYVGANYKQLTKAVNDSLNVIFD